MCHAKIHVHGRSSNAVCGTHNQVSFLNIRFHDFLCEHGSSGFASQSLRQHNLKSTFKMISEKNFLVYVLKSGNNASAKLRLCK